MHEQTHQPLVYAHTLGTPHMMYFDMHLRNCSYKPNDPFGRSLVLAERELMHAMIADPATQGLTSHGGQAKLKVGQWWGKTRAWWLSVRTQPDMLCEPNCWKSCSAFSTCSADSTPRFAWAVH